VQIVDCWALVSLSGKWPNINVSGLLGIFGEVERMGTFTTGMEAFSLGNGAVFPTLLWTEKRGETCK
jgi:hypothetical protein